MSLMASSAPSPSPETLSRVSRDTVGRAVDALVKWVKSKAKSQKAQLLEHDEFLYLILTLKKIPPKARVNPYKLPLPHPLHPLDASEELCLIFDDRSRSNLTSEAAKTKIQSESIPISKVLKLSKLKSDYRAFEAKRQLCNSYDLFFADKRVIPVLPKLLGKQFFKKKKIPIPIDLTHKNWKEQIQNSCGSALMHLRAGTCTVVKVGRVSQGRDQIVDNVLAVIDGALEIVPKKWENVRSLHLKASESLALPVYQALPEIGLKIDGAKKEGDLIEEVGIEVGVEEKEKKEKKEKKMRRIHEVDLDELLLGSVSGDDVDDEEEISENGEMGSAELTGKKRKKKSEDLNGEKQQKKSTNGKRGNVKKQKKNGLTSEEAGVQKEEEASDEVELKQKKKSKIGKMENGGMKTKNKKNKRVQAAV